MGLLILRIQFLHLGHRLRKIIPRNNKFFKTKERCFENLFEQTNPKIKELVTETFFGSASLLEVSDKELEALKEDVTSPGGTTEAGLNFLDKMDIDNIVFKMINSAVNRSKELSKKIN